MLAQAAADFCFLQNRSYPRASALEWVGDRYRLTRLERHLLHRGVFSQKDALRRRAKRGMGAVWQNERLTVDGHNVQITVESAILGRPLLLANDGALRDLAGESSRFRMSEVSLLAMEMLLRFLDAFRPRAVLFLFDAPMSHSGALAAAYRQQLKRLGLPGDARAVPVPEREFPTETGVVASSDHAVLDSCPAWVDLARKALESGGPLRFDADFSAYVPFRSAGDVPPIGDGLF